MIITQLLYHRPTDVEKASDILTKNTNDSAVLGGGTWLLPRMHRHEVNVNHVVDLRGLGLDSIEVQDDFVEIGAMVTYSDVLASDELTETVPLLTKVAGGITGGNQIRNLGTLVGSACFANPSSDVPGALVALGAQLRIASNRGVREVSAHNFFKGAFTVDLQPGEFVTSFAVPRRSIQTSYYKLKISGSSWPISTASAVLNETTGEVSVTLGALEQRPLTVDLSGAIDTKGNVRGDEVTKLVCQRITDPWSDVLATGEFRQQVAPVVARRALEKVRGITIR